MKRRSIRNENLQKIEAAHVLKAATYCLDHPEVRSHSKKYGVEIDGTWFTPRDLLKQASAQAGVPLIDAFMSQYDARWRERLRCLASLSTSAASRVTRKMNQALNKTWPHPARCLREFSRSTSGMRRATGASTLATSAFGMVFDTKCGWTSTQTDKLSRSL